MAVERIKTGGLDLPDVVVPTKLERRGTCRPQAAERASNRDEMMVGDGRLG
jgi:hypothetical protein